jgi:phage baseplate assembly protein W
MAIRRALSTEDTGLDTVTLATTRNRKYIDFDIAFTPKPVSGDLYKKTEAAAVKQAVKNLLLTNFGERPFQPYFGGNITRYLFELTDDMIEARIKKRIQSAIKAYEPRVDFNTLVVKTNIQPDSNSIEVTVVFRVINSLEEITLTTSINRLR